MLSPSAVVSNVLGGIALGLRFHPVFAVVAASLAAGLVGYARAPRFRAYWGVAVLLAGWALGDGLRLAALSRGPAIYVLTSAIVGLGVGYLLPALAGAYVGRQVHRGTGYLSAAAVAIMLVFAVSAVAAPIADAIANAVL